MNAPITVHTAVTTTYTLKYTHSAVTQTEQFSSQGEAVRRFRQLEAEGYVGMKLSAYESAVKVTKRKIVG